MSEILFLPHFLSGKQMFRHEASSGILQLYLCWKVRRKEKDLTFHGRCFDRESFDSRQFLFCFLFSFQRLKVSRFDLELDLWIG